MSEEPSIIMDMDEIRTKLDKLKKDSKILAEFEKWLNDELEDNNNWDRSLGDTQAKLEELKRKYAKS